MLRCEKHCKKGKLLTADGKIEDALRHFKRAAEIVPSEKLTRRIKKMEVSWNENVMLKKVFCSVYHIIITANHIFIYILKYKN